MQTYYPPSNVVLVGGFNPSEKIVKSDHFPKIRDEHQKIFELPPPRFFFALRETKENTGLAWTHQVRVRFIALSDP